MAIRRQVLRAEVEDLILDRLLESHWPPGARLSIDGLARDLEVSPTPVREAMVSLERSGMVEYVALRGYVVAPMLDRGQMKELMAVRKVVECAALSWAFDDYEALLAELETAQKRHAEVLKRMEAAGRADYELMREHFQADWGFHQVLFDRARNRYLSGMVEALRAHTHRMRQTWEQGPASLDIREAFTEHGKVLEMVRRHHQDGALSALEQHLNEVLVRSLSCAEPEDAREAG